MATLEKRQRHFKEPSLNSLEFEVFPTPRRGAACSELFLVFPTSGLLSNHNPNPTFRTSDARARNAISHSKIILRWEQRAAESARSGLKIPTLLLLRNFVAVRTLGGGLREILGRSSQGR